MTQDVGSSTYPPLQHRRRPARMPIASRSQWPVFTDDELSVEQRGDRTGRRCNARPRMRPSGTYLHRWYRPTAAPSKKAVPAGRSCARDRRAARKRDAAHRSRARGARGAQAAADRDRPRHAQGDRGGNRLIPGFGFERVEGGPAGPALSSFGQTLEQRGTRPAGPRRPRAPERHRTLPDRPEPPRGPGATAKAKSDRRATAPALSPKPVSPITSRVTTGRRIEMTAIAHALCDGRRPPAPSAGSAWAGAHGKRGAGQQQECSPSDTPRAAARRPGQRQDYAPHDLRQGARWSRRPRMARPSRHAHRGHERQQVCPHHRSPQRGQRVAAAKRPEARALHETRTAGITVFPGAGLALAPFAGLRGAFLGARRLGPQPRGGQSVAAASPRAASTSAASVQKTANAPALGRGDRGGHADRPSGDKPRREA